MLKRNTRKLIKYVLILFTLITLSILLLKSFFTVNAIDKNNDKSKAKFSGLPNDPSNQKNHIDSSTERKKNWHNYTQITMEKKRVGPGEQGAAFYLPPGTEKRKDDLYKVNGFNGLASDYIAINRSITDIRHKDCAKKKYLRKLPTASVVVPFHNEHLSTLLRTATSVINRSPPELIKEILLVDDFSTKSELKHELESYLQQHLPKVRVLRATKREGLIRARLMGAKAATGDVLIFLDSHTEANVNWLPPLLEPIAEDPQTVVCPFIDVIDYETFAYRAQDEGARGSFDWELYYKRLPLLPQDLKHPAQPFESPVMAGGLFSMDRAFFWRLGGYDEGLDVWGGEQYELSFKIWQCGGRMVDAPCSRIGHIYRKFPPFPNPGIGDFVGKNYKRVAEVWMDEYAEYLYLRRPHYRSIDPGDLSKQKELRRRLQCKTFKWFMTEIAFDQSKKYPPIEPPPYAYGEIRNAAANLCIDTRFRNQNDRFGIEDCIKDNKNSGGEQNFELTWHKDIRPKHRLVCFDVSTSEDHAPVVLWGCHGMQGNQEWKYDYVKQHLFHPISGHCLDCDIERKEIFMSPCDNKVPTQKWAFHNYNRTALDIWPQV